VRRLLACFPVLVLAVAALWGADDTTKAAATRQKLQQEISVDYKETLLRDVMEDLKEKVEGVGILADTKGGVNLNTKITYKADNKPVTEILNDISDKYALGYFVISQKGNGYDGSLKITRGKERGYQEGQQARGGPKAEEKTGTAEKPRDRLKDKDRPKAAEKPRADDRPKAEDRPADDDPEGTAARKLKLIKELIEGGKIEKAKERLEELTRRYPKTKAAEEAKDLLKGLDKGGDDPRR